MSCALRDPPAALSLGRWRPRGIVRRARRAKGTLRRWSGRSESLWVTPPALADARRVAVARVRRADGRSTGSLLALLPVSGDGPGGVVAGRAAGGLREPDRGRGARPAGRAAGCAAAAPTCRARSPTTTPAPRCCARSRPVARAAGCVHRPAVLAEQADRGGGGRRACTTTSSRRRPRTARGSAAPRRCGSRRTSTAPACPGPDPSAGCACSSTPTSARPASRDRSTDRPRADHRESRRRAQSSGR